MHNTVQNQISNLERELVSERQAREALVKTSIQLNSLLNLPDLLHAIMKAATTLLEAETSSLLLLDEATDELTFAVSTDAQDTTIKTLRIPANQGIAGWALEHNEMVVVNDVTDDPRFYKNIDQQSGFTTHSILAVPLKIRESAIGVVEVMNKCHGATFTDRDQDIATAFAALAAIAIDNAHLYQRMADALVDSRISYRL